MTVVGGEAVRHRTKGFVAERLAGGFLAALGVLFFLRVIATLVNAPTQGSSIAGTDLALDVSDLLTAPAIVIGGVLLWQRNKLGYVTGLGLRVHTSILFIGLAAVLVTKPFLTSAPLATVELTVVLGLVCSVPLALLLRGMISDGG